MNHTIIEVPAGKMLFTIEELPYLFADSIPSTYQADTDIGNQVVRIARASKEYWPFLEAALEQGTLPVLTPGRLPARYPSGAYGKRMLVSLEALMKWASQYNFEVREARAEQATAAPAQHEAERPPEVEQPEQVESEGQEENSAVAELSGLFDPVSVASLQKMFPDEKWPKLAERAGRNGLSDARVGRAMFNPYRTAIWWLGKRKPAGWDLARVHRVLANNLPARSFDSKQLLTGELE